MNCTSKFRVFYLNDLRVQSKMKINFKKSPGNKKSAREADLIMRAL